MEYNALAVPVPLANPGTVTISNATPAAVTKAAHALPAGTPVSFTTTGVLPAPLQPFTQYFVSATNLNVNDFALCFDPAGAGGAAGLIGTTTAGSGVHTCNVEVLRVDCSREKQVSICVTNKGANPLSATFTIAGRVTKGTGPKNIAKSCPEFPLSTVGADYTTPNYPVVKASASPISLAAAGTVWILVNTEGFNEIIVRTLATVAAGSVDMRAASKVIDQY